MTGDFRDSVLLFDAESSSREMRQMDLEEMADDAEADSNATKDDDNDRLRRLQEKVKWLEERCGIFKLYAP